METETKKVEMVYNIKSSDIKNKCIPVTTACVYSSIDMIKNDFFGLLYGSYQDPEQRKLEKMFKGASKKVTFFTTDQELDVAVVYRNNMITNAVYHDSGARGFGFKHGTAHKTSDKDGKVSDMSVGEVDGVYAIETYTIQKTNGLPRSRNNIIKYLKERNPIELPDDVKRGIVNQVNIEFKTLHDIHISIIHFIPKSVIQHDVTVYSSALDVVFTLKDVSNTLDPIRHPWSDIQISADSLTKLNAIKEPFIFTLNITNNENRNKEYYYKTGNDVLKIMSTTNSLTPNGYHYRVIKNDQIITDKQGSLAELPNLGVYENIDVCKYNGDPQLRLGIEKLNNDIATMKALQTKTHNELKLAELKIETDKLKYKAEKKKYKSEKKSMERKLLADEQKFKAEEQKYETDIKLMEGKLKSDQLKLDMEHLKYRAEETRHEEYKEKHDLTLQRMDKETVIYLIKAESDRRALAQKQQLDLSMAVNKHQIDINNARTKHQIDINNARTKHQIDINNTDIKHTRELDKIGLDTAAKAMNFSTSMLNTIVKVL